MPFLEASPNLKGYIGGEKGFDPLGLSYWVPMDWLRESELKHGRVCMLATLGFVATDMGFVLPGDMHQVSSIGAHDVAVAQGSMTQIAIFIAICFDPLQIGGGDDPEMQLREIENGRLAMLAFAGIVTQAVLTGKGFPYF